MADSYQAEPHPAGEGLRWIAGGFGALGLTDHEILQREFVALSSEPETDKKNQDKRGYA